VILNPAERGHRASSKRLIDFASGLTYAPERQACSESRTKVFLLTRGNVEVSAEQRAALLEPRRLFFNQA